MEDRDIGRVLGLTDSVRNLLPAQPPPTRLKSVFTDLVWRTWMVNGASSKGALSRPTTRDCKRRWCTAYAELDQRRQARCRRYRFRKNPALYLAQLEEACSKLNLPS